VTRLTEVGQGAGSLAERIRLQPLSLILLDEISAHFDATRRGALFAEIVRLRSQAFMTGTDRGVFAPFGDGAQYYSLGNGAIIG
jgi:DNA replication and repair protein RecF